MKKKTIIDESIDHEGYVIFSLSANTEDFRVAFLLNKQLKINLQRKDNLIVYANHKSAPESYSYFDYNRLSQTWIYLIHNLDEPQPLIKHYFLIINGFIPENEEEKIITALDNIPEILSFNRLNLSLNNSSDKKSKKTAQVVNAILTDLEYHVIGINKKENAEKIQLKHNPSKSVRKLYS